MTRAIMSLRASNNGIHLARIALTSLGLTQELVMARVGCSRQPVSNFFNGNPVSRNIFVAICNVLDLDWQETAYLTQAPEEDIEVRINELRDAVNTDIETRCGTMRILDMTQPIGLSDIYTQVNFLEKIIGRRRKNIDELFQNCNLKNFERFGLGKVKEEKIPAKEAVTKYRKLLILGKPGAGKTTFLKHLAIQCNQGDFQADLVPFFVTLKDFAEAEDQPGLLAYLSNYLLHQNQETIEQIFYCGKASILLDGLDEVLKADIERVIKEIRDFSTQYPENQYVMTCRIAAREYTFDQFTEVEIADFDWQQITTFASNWFQDQAIRAETFLERLEQDEPIQELASNPLLLTLLCLAFEESGDFPANRGGLYKEGLDALLKKWDAKRGISRDEVYKKLWVHRKEDLLSKIAWDTFASGEYFFRQDKAERYISEYIRNLPGVSEDEEALRLDSEVVLKSIEAQHGLLVARAKHIYSFSHLTFQEYFTAREIVIVRQSAESALQDLISHIFDTRWREIFFLAVGMSHNADRLILSMKEKIDSLLAEDKKLQGFLFSLTKKAISLSNTQQSSTLPLNVARSLYFAITLNITTELANLLNHDSTCNFIRSRERSLDRHLMAFLKFASYLVNCHTYLETIIYLSELEEAFDNILNYTRNSSLNHELYSKIIELAQETESYNPRVQYRHIGVNLIQQNRWEVNINWWANKGQEWIERLRSTIIQYRYIGHDWQFSYKQTELLEKYYFANRLLTQCLHRECYVSREVRQEIEETLLLPISEIEQRTSLGTI